MVEINLISLNPDFGEQELENLNRCIETGWISGGNFVKEFEEKVKMRHK